MKNIFIILGLIFSLSLIAQKRSVNINGSTLVNVLNTKNVAYNGTINDRLIPTTRDTIDYYVILSNYGSGPLHFYANFTFDTIAGADTTIAITVMEKKFGSQDYTDVIASSLTPAISAETQVVKTSIGVISPYTDSIAAAVDIVHQQTTTNADTINVSGRTITSLDNTLLYYRYLKFRLILQGNDAVGTGIKVKRVELQFFQ
jgi:hypothetical protein